MVTRSNQAMTCQNVDSISISSFYQISLNSDGRKLKLEIWFKVFNVDITLKYLLNVEKITNIVL